LLRARAGDYVREQLAEGSGVQGAAFDLDALPGARCNRDVCAVVLDRGGRHWHLLATRSSYLIDWAALSRACAWADIAVSDRRLPRSCHPKWLRLDRTTLGQTGGLALNLDPPAVRSVNADDRHPWIVRAAPSRYWKKAPNSIALP
jgi:competence protein ComEC